jgi:predicted transposase YbfD/YdcC
MPASSSSLTALESVTPPCLSVQDCASGLLEALAMVPDPRARRGVRHRLTTVVAASMCAVVAGNRSYAAIAEWVIDLPEHAAATLGMQPERRPSESMIRRLLQALDPQRLNTVVGGWFHHRLPDPPAGDRRAIAVDGKTMRGSSDADTPPGHVLAAVDHATGVVLAQTDVAAKTTETVYGITDLPIHHAKPAQLAHWARGHWSIENKIHWIRDVTYDEDRSQIRVGTGAHVMAALRNTAISLLRLAGSTNIAAANRHHARNPTRPLDLLGIT